MERRRNGRRIVLGLVISLVVSLGIAGWHQGAIGTETSSGPYRHGIVVVGDSITARYDDDPGSPRQGWWSLVARHYDAPVRTYAQSGSGYQRPGLTCTGDDFLHRTAVLDGPAPSVVIIEGGRNDWVSCRRGSLVVSTNTAVERGVTQYLTLLKERLPHTTRIVVLGPPWGPRNTAQQHRITSIVHAVAQRQGVEYVSTRGTLDRPGRTVDGVHPTLAGSRALAGAVIAALDRPRPA